MKRLSVGYVSFASVLTMVLSSGAAIVTSEEIGGVLQVRFRSDPATMLILR